VSADDNRAKAQALVRAAIDEFAEREATRLLDATNGLIERVALQVAKHFEPVPTTAKKPPLKPNARKSLTNAVWLIAEMDDEEAALAVALIRAVKAPKQSTGVN